MKNAKQELLSDIKDIKSSVKCARIYNQAIEYEWSDEKPLEVLLKVGYTEDDFQEFLKQLDFYYDNGYGGQNLFGYVWFENGTWLDRGEYDGSEWWQYQKMPDIPKELLSK